MTAAYCVQMDGRGRWEYEARSRRFSVLYRNLFLFLITGSTKYSWLFSFSVVNVGRECRELKSARASSVSVRAVMCNPQPA